MLYFLLLSLCFPLPFYSPYWLPDHFLHCYLQFHQSRIKIFKYDNMLIKQFIFKKNWTTWRSNMQIIDVLFPTLLGTFQGKYFMTSHHIVSLYNTWASWFTRDALLTWSACLAWDALPNWGALCYLRSLSCLRYLSYLRCFAYLVLTFSSNFSHHCTEFLYMFNMFHSTLPVSKFFKGK